MNDPDTLLVLLLALFLVPVGIGAVLCLWALRSWLRATGDGAQLTIFEVVGMKLRRIDVDAIAAAMALADEHGVFVSHVDLQEAWQAGVDVTAITEAWIAVQLGETKLTFGELRALHREGRLDELPRLPPVASP